MPYLLYEADMHRKRKIIGPCRGRRENRDLSEVCFEILICFLAEQAQGWEPDLPD